MNNILPLRLGEFVRAIVAGNKLKISRSGVFATIVVENMNGEEIFVDSRPSDAIALAIRAKAPIYVTPEVMAKGAISINSEKDRQEEQEFKDFIKEVKPSDFEKLINKNFESDT